MQFETQSIKCNIFRDTETVIKKTEAKINQSGNSKEKQYYAQDILLEVEALSLCENYNIRNPDCLNCRSVLHNYFQEYEHLAKDKMRKHQYNGER